MQKNIAKFLVLPIVILIGEKLTSGNCYCMENINDEIQHNENIHVVGNENEKFFEKDYLNLEYSGKYILFKNKYLKEYNYMDRIFSMFSSIYDNINDLNDNKISDKIFENTKFSKPSLQLLNKITNGFITVDRNEIK